MIDHFEGRRIRTIKYTKPAAAWVANVQGPTFFLYDGWNLIAERNGSVTRSYVWGPDMSGTLQGAGGIGGLLAMKDSTTGKTYGYGYDANGNVAVLTDLSSGAVVASYEYGPFGENIRSTDFMAVENHFRWSTKFTDDESGLVYYGYRFYQPQTGRWLNRDPLYDVDRVFPEELPEGPNVYEYLANDPLGAVDPLGLFVAPFPGGGFPFPNPPPVRTGSGFEVIATTIDEWYGPIARYIGASHVDISYNGTVIYIGKGGGVGRLGIKYEATNRVYRLTKQTKGTLKIGSKAGCPCSQATDKDIEEALTSRKESSGKNCQGDVQDALSEVCLTGYTSLVGTLFPR